MRDGRINEGDKVVWYKEGKRHRDNGPATEMSDGTTIWYQHGLIHREGEPAWETPQGKKEWIVHGKHHREDGPAIEYSGGKKDFFLNDIRLTEEEYNRWLEKRNLNERLQENLQPLTLEQSIIKKKKI